MTRGEWKAIVLTAVERSGRRLSLWAIGPGPKESGRWFANLTDRHTGGHVHLSSATELGPFGMVEDLVRQLTGPDRRSRQRMKKRGPVTGTRERQGDI